MNIRSIARCGLAAGALSLAACTTTAPAPTETAPAPAPPSHGPGAAVFYIGAHPDDIELFMGRNAWLDVAAPDRHVVFIVVTAGDAGLGTDYFMARESGHERALRFWSSLDGAALAPTRVTTVTAGGRSLERRAIGSHVVSYNLRLPDGDMEGEGYPVTGVESLRRLIGGAVPQLHAVDGRLQVGYADLQAILAGVIAREAQGAREVWVNIQDEDRGRNVDDHSDHTSTALAVVAALHEPRFACVGVARYLDYVIAGKTQNLTAAETLVHAGTWGALNSGRVDGSQVTTWDTQHVSWIGREYFRTTPGKGDCAF
jgi:LmbE family N-acetylglucosaminyl deacetylase